MQGAQHQQSRLVGLHTRIDYRERFQDKNFFKKEPGEAL